MDICILLPVWRHSRHIIWLLLFFFFDKFSEFAVLIRRQVDGHSIVLRECTHGHRGRALLVLHSVVHGYSLVGLLRACSQWVGETGLAEVLLQLLIQLKYTGIILVHWSVVLMMVMVYHCNGAGLHMIALTRQIDALKNIASHLAIILGPWRPLLHDLFHLVSR